MSQSTDSDPDDVESWVADNHDLIAQVLRQGNDPYARACALVLLKEASTERDVDAVKQEVDELC